MKTPPVFRDKATGEPCERRGSVLCGNTDPDHRHVAIAIENRATFHVSATCTTTEGPRTTHTDEVSTIGEVLDSLRGLVASVGELNVLSIHIARSDEK